jgi:hypothetical protein
MKDAYIRSLEVVGSPCPNCGVVLDGVTGISLAGPFEQPVELKDGVTRCVYCDTFLIFTDNRGTVRQMTEKERRTIPPEVAALYQETEGLGKKIRQRKLQ